MDRGIFDQAEFKKALPWVKANCKEGKDYNSSKTKRSRQRLDREWEISVKMAIIARDLMVGNPKLAAMGFGEESHGHNAIASVSRASGNGRITSPTAIFWKRF